jgi:hypothetical protein
MSALEKRLAIVLLALSAVTVLSWWLAGDAALQSNATITFAVLVIAALKVRIIVMEFMEARHAPALLRRFTDAWLVLLVSVLLVIYLIGLHGK